MGKKIDFKPKWDINKWTLLLADVIFRIQFQLFHLIHHNWSMFNAEENIIWYNFAFCPFQSKHYNLKWLFSLPSLHFETIHLIQRENDMAVIMSICSFHFLGPHELHSHEFRHSTWFYIHFSHLYWAIMDVNASFVIFHRVDFIVFNLILEKVNGLHRAREGVNTRFDFSIIFY